MISINEVIIVEGKHDVSFLKTFLDASFIVTEGTSIPSSTIDLINAYKASGKQFIILTDPDYPGTYIRNKLLQIIPDAKVGFVDKEKAKTSKKVGIEHSDEQTIMETLRNLVTISKNCVNISRSDLYEIGLFGNENSQKIRNMVCTTLKIGKCNFNSFFQRINSLGITKEQLMNIIHLEEAVKW